MEKAAGDTRLGNIDGSAIRKLDQDHRFVVLIIQRTTGLYFFAASNTKTAIEKLKRGLRTAKILSDILLNKNLIARRDETTR